MWLPLALASMMATVVNALKSESAPSLKLSDILASWALPTMAAAMRKEEEEADAERTIANFNALAERFGGKKVMKHG